MSECEHLWFDHGQFSTCVKCCASNCEHIWDGVNGYITCVTCFEVHPETRKLVGKKVAKRLEELEIERDSPLWKVCQASLKRLGGDME